MIVRVKAMFLGVFLMAILTSCGMLVQTQTGPTPISMEAISTMVAQTLIAQQAQSPPTLEPPPPTEFPVTPTITLTATPSKPFIVATIDTNCRTGADPVWNVVGAFKKDTEAEVIGMWLNGAWYLINNPSNPDLGKCWVWGSSVTRKGDWSRVPNIYPPATPTALP